MQSEEHCNALNVWCSIVQRWSRNCEFVRVRAGLVVRVWVDAKT